MGQNLQQLKRRIKISNNVSKIANVMEMIAMSKIHKAQELVEAHNPYLKKIEYITYRTVLEKKILKTNKKTIKEKCNKKLVYIISADKGLCGNLIANILKKIISYTNYNDYIVTIGKKIASNTIMRNYNVIASFNIGSCVPKYDNIYPIIDIAKKIYLSNKITKISIIYTKFKNILIQEPYVNEVFPIKNCEILKKEDRINYIFEPSIKLIFEDLISCYLESIFFNSLINSYASEQAARIIAMKNAKDNANEISTYLTNIYNKYRQEKITNEILDIANFKHGI
ncbi:MAG: ATP synthase F1 subunit gamma [Endomicrobium sp.]|jgi:F-type H+-transporting ATPase subunit gamma|nr:ATP synthase F1 subunit gamma [Endomicrobium sp.]